MSPALLGSQGPLGPGFSVRGARSGIPLPPVPITTKPPPAQPPYKPPPNPPFSFLERERINPPPSHQPYKPPSKDPLPFSFLEQEKRGQLKKKATREWGKARERNRRKLDHPPGAPSSQPEPPKRKSGKLRQEPTNVQPQTKGFEKGMFLARNFPYLRTFSNNLHTYINVV